MPFHVADDVIRYYRSNALITLSSLIPSLSPSLRPFLTPFLSLSFAPSFPLSFPLSPSLPDLLYTSREMTSLGMLSVASLTQARGRSPLCSALLSCISLGAAMDNMVFASCDSGIVGILIQVLKVFNPYNTSHKFYIPFIFPL